MNHSDSADSPLSSEVFALFERNRVAQNQNSEPLQWIGGAPDAALEASAEVDVMCQRIEWLRNPEDRVIVHWPTDESSVNVLLAYQASQNTQSGPDEIRLPVPAPTRLVGADGKAHLIENLQWDVPTTFWPHPVGVSCVIGVCVFHFRAAQIALGNDEKDGFATASLEELHEAIRARNARLKLTAPASPAPTSPAPTRLPTRSATFPIRAEPEWTALLQTAADGKRLHYFVGHAQATAIRHQRPDAPFWTETHLTCEEICAGYGLDLLHKAASQLDLDAGLIWLYVSHTLAARGQTERSENGDWIDLEDVARKTLGGYADNPKDARERRQKVWHALQYGARTLIVGRRKVPYLDPVTGQKLDTLVQTTPWQIFSQQQIFSPTLVAEQEPPLRVEIALSGAWLHLTASPQTAQILPLGELLGAISPARASGAWARSLGMAYFHWCRLHLKPALRGDAPPARAALMRQFPPRGSDFEDLLRGNDPMRALKYWCDAESLLREIGVLESAPTARKPARRRAWQDDWKNASPAWKPGPVLHRVLQDLSTHLPQISSPNETF